MRPPALAAAALAVAALAGCSDGGGHPPRSAPTTTAPTAIPTTTPAGSAAPAITVPASALADPGLPSQVGPPPLSTATLTRLMQYFEDNVSQAYANGDADSLYHYLAGTMLTGNRATINLLNGRHQRNVFKITVTSTTVDSSDASRIVLSMNADMTVNYFYDTATNQQVGNGLSTSGPISFEIFLDFNPANRTWYWTGESSTTSNG